jgi:formylglycine-generating enzyme required for sulfatase activity
MKKTTLTKITLATLCFAGFGVTSAHADNFGSGGNSFSIQFADVGNAGNGNDAGAGGGIYSSPYGGVSYNYRIGVTEVSQDWITKATNLGMTNVTAGAWGASQPAANMTWYEAAAFVNWMNTSTGHQAAYQLNGTNTALTLWTGAQAWQAGGQNLYRHKDAYYFLPSENEWYKAAYHQNDGVTANYWDYPTASNAVPDGIDFSGDTAFDAVFDQGFLQGAPNAVTNVGSASAYGTRGQGGNVQEWTESADDGVNNFPGEGIAFRGGSWAGLDNGLLSQSRSQNGPQGSDANTGFRVASVPEPSSVAASLLGVGVLMARRRRRR